MHVWAWDCQHGCHSSLHANRYPASCLELATDITCPATATATPAAFVPQNLAVMFGQVNTINNQSPAAPRLFPRAVMAVTAASDNSPVKVDVPTAIRMAEANGLRSSWANVNPSSVLLLPFGQSTGAVADVMDVTYNQQVGEGLLSGCSMRPLPLVHQQAKSHLLVPVLIHCVWPAATCRRTGWCPSVSMTFVGFGYPCTCPVVGSDGTAKHST
jgi:hypothetical protein